MKARMSVMTATNTDQSQVVPFRIEPQYVGRVWGFLDLRPWYDHASDGEPVGEVWLTGDECKVATGRHTGTTLGRMFSEMPGAMLGTAAAAPASPLLLKLLFAKEKLSVQVHPDDKMAHKYGEPRGKTECWYALAAEPGTVVALGLKPGVTLEQVEAEIHDGTLEQSLNMVEVTPGDMIFVDAGTVHAVWPGGVLLETQQYSDLTYRMYDYGRPRDLHIEKSLEAVRLKTRAGKVSPTVMADRTVLLDSEYFRVERIPVASTLPGTSLAALSESRPGLAYLFAAAGTGRIKGPSFEAVDLPARGIVAVPAGSPAFEVENLGGLDLIRITPKWPGKSA
jgi:mannose-6-phosphate isomerase